MRDNALPSFQFAPEAFLGGTQHMTPAEVGAYLRLLIHQWQTGWIPNDYERIATITGMSRDEFKRAVEVLRPKFEDVGEGRLINKRMDQTRRDAVAHNNKCVIVGEEQDAKNPCPFTQIIGYWNSLMGTKIRVTEARKRKLRARWRDEFWRENWADAMRRMMQSSFCMGRNDRGWVANMNWFLKPDTVDELIEGKHDDRTATTPTRRERELERQAAHVEEFVRRTDGQVVSHEASGVIDCGRTGSVVRDVVGLLGENRRSRDLKADNGD